ncbi:hypothetical protein SUGI_0982080 [Cryptomeria japonica]|nr:hypothetical protein SUGI_0982080 [Cryptomeria japonica]
MFGVLFPNRSFPMDMSSFSQIDTLHWVLDMNYFVGEAYDQIKEMCIFLLNEFSLPPDKVLSVYIQSPAKIGVSVEDLSMIPALNVSQQQRIEHLAMKVGENLFNFMQSFCSMDGNKLVVPSDILDRWFKKFQERAKRDPEYLKSFVI